MSQNEGLTLMAILAPFYIGGVFLFSYGYELYNVPKALRLTALPARVVVRRLQQTRWLHRKPQPETLLNILEHPNSWRK